MLRTVLSFSGGKDSFLALYELQQQGIEVVCLVTTAFAADNKTVAHGESLDQIRRQGQRLGIPVTFVKTNFERYGDDFLQHLVALKNTYHIDAIAFGDIYLRGHREWGETLASKAGLEALYPLWTTQDQALPLLHEFIDLGFKARVIKVDEAKLPTSWIGRLVDLSFAEEIAMRDVCPMGESGEYHTVVESGPCFKS